MPRGKAAKIAIWVLGILVVAVAAVLVTGWLLPEEHRAEVRETIPASPEQVYALISDVERFPAWRSDVTRVEVESREPELRFREHDDGESILYVVDSAVPGERFETRIADESLPFGGSWTITLRPAGAGTELHIVEEGAVYNPVFRFVSRFVIGHDAMLERYLSDVQRWFVPESP